MLHDRFLRIAELHELLAKEMRALAFAAGHGVTPDTNYDQALMTPATAAEARRKEDTLVRLAEFGYLSSNSTIHVIGRLTPASWSPEDSRLRARIGANPSRPIWEATGETFRSLTALSKFVRDEFGVSFPESSFNPCKYWCIEGEETERTLESIARQLVL